MGALYDISQRLMREIERQNPDPLQLLKIKGEVARTSGFMVSMVSPDDADDPAKIERLRNAARELGIEL